MHTSRGRLAAYVVDSYDQLGAGATGQDWLPAQAEPATANLLLGLTKGAGERTLVLSNPGADEVRATITVVTPTSTFAPTGVEPVRVAPDSTEAVSLDDVLVQAAKDGAIGLLVESNHPVTTSLRQFSGADLSLLGAAPAVDAATAVVVPAGPKHLLLAGADAAGGATVTVVRRAREAAGPAGRRARPRRGREPRAARRRGPGDGDPTGHLGAGRGAGDRHRHRRRTAA